jgi:hypothetical protein
MSTAAAAVDRAGRGKVIRNENGKIMFAPTGTTYELHLEPAAQPYNGPLNVPTGIIVRCQGRKVMSVPSGGTFITPIQGPPRIVQGRVKHLDDKQLVIQAGTTVVVDLPMDNHAIDLNNGAIAVGSMVNATILPGARYELP